MARLTGWDGENAYCLKCFEGNMGCANMGTGKCDCCIHPQAVYRKCAAYEDTGLSPERVKELAEAEMAMKGAAG